MAVPLSPHGLLAATGGFDNHVYLWALRKGRLIERLSKHQDCILSLCFSKDSALLASGCAGEKICIWDTVRKQLVQRIETHGQHVLYVRFDPDNSILPRQISSSHATVLPHTGHRDGRSNS